jgi:hypothetical protein
VGTPPTATPGWSLPAGSGVPSRRRLGGHRCSRTRGDEDARRSLAPVPGRRHRGLV